MCDSSVQATSGHVRSQPSKVSATGVCASLSAQVHARLRHTGRFAAWDSAEGGVSHAGEEEEAAQHLHPAMAATAVFSGRTLRQLARQPQPAAAASPAGPAAAGSQRPEPGGVATPARARDAGKPIATPEAGSPENDELLDVASMYEHHDSETDALEARQRELEQ